MRAVFLAAIVFALVGVGVWLVLSPAPGEPAPRSLAESASPANDASGELRAEISTARAESLPDSADAPEPAAASNAKHLPTCAELFRPGDFWVRWLDREGQPAPAPDAALVSREASEDFRSRPHHSHGAEQLWRASPNSIVGIRLREQQTRLMVDGVFPRAPIVDFSFEPERTTPHELRLPPHATLVLVVDDGGLDLPTGTSCKVSIASLRAARDYHRELDGKLDDELSVSLVSLDAELEITAIAFRKQLRETRVVRAPAVDGQRARAVLSFGSSAPLLRGRVQDDVGALLVETRLHALLKSGDQEQGATLFTTPDGHFLWSPALRGDAPWRAALELATSAGLKASVGEFEIPAMGVVDLGALELHARSAGFGGRVVDGNGVPVANALVQIEVLSIGAEPPPTPIPSFLEGTLRNAARDAAKELPPEAREQTGAGMSKVLAKHGPLKSKLRTDEHGRFASEDPRAGDPSNLFLVTATKGFTASEPLAFPGGSRAIELRLEDLGELGGRVLLPPGPIPPIVMRLRSIAPGVPAAIDRERTRLNTQGRFQWLNLAPGRYELEVAFASLVAQEDPVPLLTLHDLLVPAGGACADLRLDPLDLRALFSTFAFELRNAPADRTLAKNAFWYRRADRGETPWSVLKDPPGEAFTWALPRGAYDFVFDFDRCRRIELRARTEGCALEVRPAYGIRVTIEHSELRKDVGSTHWQPRFDYEVQPSRFLYANKISAGVFELEVPMPGALLVSGPGVVSLEERESSLQERDSALIVVEDAQELQEFRVKLR